MTDYIIANPDEVLLLIMTAFALLLIVGFIAQIRLIVRIGNISQLHLQHFPTLTFDQFKTFLNENALEFVRNQNPTVFHAAQSFYLKWIIKLILFNNNVAYTALFRAYLRAKRLHKPQFS